MVALFFYSLILGCFESKTATQKAREYLLHDPQKAVHFIQSLSKEEQVYIVTHLSEELPQRIPPLCSIIEGDAQKRCLRIAKRPHLWTTTQSKSAKQSTSDECAHAHICFEQEAMKAITQKNISEAIQACTKIEDLKWSSECIFHSAEWLLEQDIEQYAHTLPICEQSNQFRNHCIQHGIFALVSMWLKQQYDLEIVTQKISSIKEIWDNHNPQESPQRIDQLWAHWMYRFAEQQIMDAKTLPSALLAHHHSNIALFSIQFAVDIDHDLEKHIDAILQNTLITHDKRRGMEPMMNLWNSSEEGRSFLGYSLRMYDSDPKIDLLIATLESIARLQPPQLARITPYTKHAHPKLRATAKRLLQFDVTQPTLQPLRFDL